MTTKVPERLLKKYGFTAPITKRKRSFMVDEILPLGLHLLDGPSGAGKTTLALLLADAITKGKDFFGHHTRRGGVLFLMLERDMQHNDELICRVLPHRDTSRLVIWDRDRFSRPRLSKHSSAAETQKSWKDVRDFLKAYQKANNRNIRLLIIDSLTEIAPQVKAHDMLGHIVAIEALRPLLKYVDGIVVLHHTNKGGLDKLFLDKRDVRDHSVLLQKTDAQWLLGRDGDYDGLRITGQVPDKELVLQWHNGTLSSLVEMTSSLLSAQHIGQRLGLSFQTLLDGLWSIAQWINKHGTQKPIKASTLSEYFGSHKQSPLIHSLYTALGFRRDRKKYRIRDRFGDVVTDRLGRPKREYLRVYYLRDEKALSAMKLLAKGVRR